MVQSTCRKNTTMNRSNLVFASQVRKSLWFSSRKKGTDNWTVPSIWQPTSQMTSRRRSPFWSTLTWESSQSPSQRWTRSEQPDKSQTSSLHCHLRSEDSSWVWTRSQCSISCAVRLCAEKSGAASAASSAAWSYTTSSHSLPHSRRYSSESESIAKVQDWIFVDFGRLRILKQHGKQALTKHKHKSNHMDCGNFDHELNRLLLHN